MKKKIITIDGWSACGKSTLAKQLAKELGYVYIDSGAMYRAITLYFLRNHVDWTDVKEVKEALKNIHIDFHFNIKSQQSEIFLNDENIEYLIRDLIIADKVSDVSAIREVRAFAVAQQQKMGKKKAIVMDGRDIGTVVFPDADLKIFMTASVDIRARRRYEELLSLGIKADFEDVKRNIIARDIADENRDISPLRRADDAIILDNSRMTVKEQMLWVMQVIQKKRDGN